MANKMHPAIEFIFEHGKHYKPGWPQKDIVRGDIGRCFDVCALNAVLGQRYRYVEGMAEDPTKPGTFLLHAWLTDGEFAYDPTWAMFKYDCSVPVPTTYIGFEFEPLDVNRFFTQVGYQGIIANAWRDPILARQILPRWFPVKEEVPSFVKI